MSPLADQADTLADFLSRHRRVVVLTGAGISAGSGIPTYRDADGVWRGSAPVQQQEFLTDPARRRRYWARSMVGWPRVRDARPNQAHLALARLQQRQAVDLIITQNVDRLHQRAGSDRVVDLHGRLDRVRCLGCGALSSRETMQERLLRHNPQRPTSPANARPGAAPPGAAPRLAARPTAARPDGDAEIAAWLERDLTVPDCSDCGGVLMPDVVFFGGSVPGERVRQCQQAVRDADALLAVGTSLQVYSGFRFCRLAAELGRPVALLNPGRTRADDLAGLKLAAECGPLLWRVAEQPLAAPPRPPVSRREDACVPLSNQPGTDAT